MADPRLGKQTLGDWAARWVPTVAGLTPKTRESYESILRRHLLPRFADTSVNRIDHPIVVGLMAEMTAAGAGAGTVRNVRDVLRLVLELARRSGAIKVNPVEGAKAPRKPPSEIRAQWPCRSALRSGRIVAIRLDAATKPVRFMLVCLLGVLVAGCAQAGSESTTSTSEGSTTSVSEPTTTSLSTSTTTAPDVTIDPNLPSAMGRGQVPWTDVGAGWYVVLYDSSKAYPASESDTREGPVVLYLVNGAGERYEVAAWEPGEYRYLADATAGSALVSGIGATLDETVYEPIDLATGTTSTVFTVNFSEQSFVDTWPPLSLTRPGGSNVVIHRSDGVREWLERRSPDGATLSMVFEQPYDEDYRKMAWLSAVDGTSLIVATKDSMRHVSNDGSSIGEVWSPPDSRCEPVRWWAADTLLAVCFGSGTDSAPLDDTGEPHLYYGRLWLIGTDGSPGDPLTDLPTEPPIVVDFGFHDAWPVGEQTLVQWRGDCGSSAVTTLDRIGEFLSIREPDDRLVHGVELVDVQNEHMTIYGWDSCAADVGGLFTFDLDGRYLSTLVPAIGDSRGVIGVKELATVYP